MDVLVYFNRCFFKASASLSYFYLYTISQLSTALISIINVMDPKWYRNNLFSIIRILLSLISTTIPILIHWHFNKTETMHFTSDLCTNCSFILMSVAVVLGQAEVCRGCSEVYQAAGNLTAIYSLQWVFESWRRTWESDLQQLYGTYSCTEWHCKSIQSFTSTLNVYIVSY